MNGILMFISGMKHLRLCWRLCEWNLHHQSNLGIEYLYRSLEVGYVIIIEYYCVQVSKVHIWLMAAVLWTYSDELCSTAFSNYYFDFPTYVLFIFVLQLKFLPLGNMFCASIKYLRTDLFLEFYTVVLN